MQRERGGASISVTASAESTFAHPRTLPTETPQSNAHLPAADSTNRADRSWFQEGSWPARRTERAKHRAEEKVIGLTARQIAVLKQRFGIEVIGFERKPRTGAVRKKPLAPSIREESKALPRNDAVPKKATKSSQNRKRKGPCKA